MRILHIDETFHPSYGYQCNPLAKFQSIIGDEIHIIAPVAEYMYPLYKSSFGDTGEKLPEEDKAYTENTGIQIHRIRAKGRIAGRLNYCTDDLYNKITEINPDVILVHCMETLTAIRVVRKYHKQYPMVLDSHMLSMASKNKFSKLFEIGYKLIVTPIIIKKNIQVIKLQDDDYVTTHLGVPESQTKFISFGTDTALFCVDKNKKNTFLKEYNLPEDTFVIVSTGKLTKAKDGLLFANAVKKKFASDRPVAIVVVANFDGEYEKGVSSVLRESENRVIFFPAQKYLDLPRFYQIADVTVFPKQCSMSFYDAQSCGSPVISEDNAINIARNSHGNGVCFKSGSLQDLRHRLEMMMNMPPLEYEAVRSAAIDFIHVNYDYCDIACEYTKTLKTAYTQFWGK